MDRLRRTLLASRASWSRAFVSAILQKPSEWPAPPIPRKSVPPGVVRKLKQHRDPELQEALRTLWPDTGKPTSAEMDAQIRRRAGLIVGALGIPTMAEHSFQGTCRGCQARASARGAQVGPDLTVYNRARHRIHAARHWNPNAEIREGFENFSVETRDGRSLSGFLVEQDDRTVVLRGLDNQNVVLSRTEIADLQPAGMSLMPEGLLDSLDDQQTRDPLRLPPQHPTPRRRSFPRPRQREITPLVPHRRAFMLRAPFNSRAGVSEATRRFVKTWFHYKLSDGFEPMVVVAQSINPCLKLVAGQFPVIPNRQESQRRSNSL